MFRLYRKLVDRHPFKTQIATAVVLSTCGDLCTQMIETRNYRDINIKRAAVMGSMGLIVFGPVCSLSMRMLHLKKFRPVPSLLVDQLVTSPVVLSMFLTLHPLMSGFEWAEVREGWFERWAGLQVSSWAVWFPVQFCNFAVVPYQFRILYLQTAALLWNMYLSYKANQHEEKD